jgi:hypothetical protein
MSELSPLFKGVWARSLPVLERYQTWILLILAINATTTIGSVLSHDFPGKTIFALVWLVAFGAALIMVILSSEIGGATSRPALVNRGRSLRRPLRSATRFG